MRRPPFLFSFGDSSFAWFFAAALIFGIVAIFFAPSSGTAQFEGGVTAEQIPGRNPFPRQPTPTAGNQNQNNQKIEQIRQIEDPVERFQKMINEGLFKEAYDGIRQWSLSADADPRKVVQAPRMAVDCLQRLNRQDETDAYLEALIETHQNNWRLLEAVAQTYSRLNHHGFVVGGEFQRGPHRGGGQAANVMERDRVRALQLMKQAMDVVIEKAPRREAADFFLRFADMWMQGRHGNMSWQLQILTDITELPEYQEGYPHQQRGGFGFSRGGPAAGAPVDQDGKPVYYDMPGSFEKAANDGQRWRWCLAQAEEYDASETPTVLMRRANFLHGQFGVQTMQQYRFFFGGGHRKQESRTWALHTLAEGETIAKLATGIERFSLPDEHNFIKLYQRAISFGGGDKKSALESLANIFQNRRQYPKAADQWRRLLEEFPRPENAPENYRDHQREQWQRNLDQIVDNWGQFEPNTVKPYKKKPELAFRYRNGNEVTVIAHRIQVEKLLDDVKGYLKSNPGRVDHRKINIQNIGHRLVRENETKYIGEQVARWTVELDPLPDHFDRRTVITPPMTSPGAYLVKAMMKDGNSDYIVVWLEDTAIARKQLDGKVYYYVADAADGNPVAKANVEFFGYKTERTNRTGNKHQVLTRQFAEFSDPQGGIFLSEKDHPDDYQWIVTARTKEGRMAYLGFDRIWFGRLHDAEYHAVKAYMITDRPVYRPDQPAHYKFWVRHAQYDMPATSDFAGKKMRIELRDPKNDKVMEKDVTLDAYGGIEGTYEIPEDATLGVWRLNIRDARNNHQYGGGTFRVEEYRKPEFEVTVDSPDEPVALGDTIKATIKADYYFGSPVTEATVKYTVKRTNHSESWYPGTRWDWLYGNGYWWFAYDYLWYPGWERWGCGRPIPSWWHRPSDPPEVVAEQEVPIGPDGTVEVEIDTAIAKAIHPDQDHRYEITAEVMDQSRRTIVGSGSVLATREPFSVYTWVNRGHYEKGETVRADFQARTLDGRPVSGDADVTLYHIRYKDGKPLEKAVYEKNLKTDQSGHASLQFNAAQAGQFRLSCKVTDSAGHTIEGAYVFAVREAGRGVADFRFNEIELVPGRKEYNPGEKIELMVNTNRPDGTVLLFLRPSNGVYLPPKVLHLAEKTTVVEVDIHQKDMPNFFIEALTIHNGQVHTTTREIVVPPEKRVLDIAVEPSSENYKPGEKAKVKLRLTDLNGEPIVGSTVVSIYDKSVEYISGGSNLGDIKEFFWKWRRNHQPSTRSNLDRHFSHITPPEKQAMGYIGVFGYSVADEMDQLIATNGMISRGQRYSARRNGGGGFGGGMGGAMPMAKGAMMMDAAAAPMSEMAEAESLSLAPGVQNGGTPANRKQAEGGGELVEATVRKEFADTALWVGRLETDADGTAEVELDMPENLTTWKINAWAMAQGTRVGHGATEVVTRKDLILRMQTPRFLVQTDRILLTANVHNYLDKEKRVQVSLELEGKQLAALDKAVRDVTIGPEGEARIDWLVEARKVGDAVIRMKALTDEESDAMQKTVPVLVHGILKQEAISGAMRPEEKTASFELTVPEARRPAESELTVRFSPTLAGSMIDALPYLANYPYGCTEQTLNRFLPTVITQRVLIDMGIDLERLEKAHANLNAQELGDPQERARQWKQYKRNPVFSKAKVDRMVKQGVQRLTEMQLSDGGWGWFSGSGERSTPHTTALVVHGLQIARQNDVAIVPGVIDRGVAWLENYQQEQLELLRIGDLPPEKRGKRRYKTAADNLDAFAFMVLVDAGKPSEAMEDFLYRDRLKLSTYSMAMVGLALEKLGDRQRLDMIMQNIMQYVEQDDENQTAWLNLPNSSWWYWYGSEFEAQAYFLKLLSRTDPKGRLASRLVKYLLNNRKHATYWNSTRDTALCVEAMAEFLRASGEASPEMTVEIWYDGELKKAVEITPENLFEIDNTFQRVGEEVAAGTHKIEIRKKGTGPLYFNAYLANFTLEDPITAAGLELKVHRKYYLLEQVEDASAMVSGGRGQAVEQKVQKYQRVPLESLDEVTSGDLVEVELLIESKNDYESIVFEDLKPAGFEPIEVRSGYNGNALGAYVEFRDTKVVFFKHRLMRGKHSVAYRLRAEQPGRFSALPTKGWAMYAPELKANANEMKLKIIDKSE